MAVVAMVMLVMLVVLVVLVMLVVVEIGGVGDVGGSGNWWCNVTSQLFAGVVNKGSNVESSGSSPVFMTYLIC